MSYNISDEIVHALEVIGVKYTISVPFKRFAELKSVIERRAPMARHRSRPELL